MPGTILVVSLLLIQKILLSSYEAGGYFSPFADNIENEH